VVVFDRLRLRFRSAFERRQPTVVVYDEWSQYHCAAFRPVVEVRLGQAWAWHRYRIAVGPAYHRSGSDFLELVNKSDKAKRRLAAKAEMRFGRANVIVDLWSEPRRKPTRFDLDIPFKIESGWTRERLQFVQTCLIRGHRDPRVGRPLPSNPSFKCFVDNGRRSPAHLGNGWPSGHPFRPYYYRPHQVADELHNDVLTYFDCPMDVEVATETYFETALVDAAACRWQPDRVLSVFRFGWIADHGVNAALRCPEPGAQPGYKDFWPADSLSDRFREIVSLDYPRYRLRS